jgi:hypothetical protein
MQKAAIPWKNAAISFDYVLSTENVFIGELVSRFASDICAFLEERREEITW